MTTHCTICQGTWDKTTGVVIGHPTELHVCYDCFEADFAPILKANGYPSARPTEAPCLVHWDTGGIRVGVPLPKNHHLTS